MASSRRSFTRDVSVSSMRHHTICLLMATLVAALVQHQPMMPPQYSCATEKPKGEDDCRSPRDAECARALLTIPCMNTALGTRLVTVEEAARQPSNVVALTMRCLPEAVPATMLRDWHVAELLGAAFHSLSSALGEQRHLCSSAP